MENCMLYFFDNNLVISVFQFFLCFLLPYQDTKGFGKPFARQCLPLRHSLPCSLIIPQLQYCLSLDHQVWLLQEINLEGDHTSGAQWRDPWSGTLLGSPVENFTQVHSPERQILLLKWLPQDYAQLSYTPEMFTELFFSGWSKLNNERISLNIVFQDRWRLLRESVGHILPKPLIPGHVIDQEPCAIYRAKREIIAREFLTVAQISMNPAQ